MLFINLSSQDPYFNLACEEYLLKNFEEDIFMLWRNDKTIVIGRNQNTLSEINTDFVKKNGITVVRRMSGGGAVYHDLGNINFSFIKNSDNLFSNYEFFTKPIISFLKSLGVNSYLSGRNDLMIDDKKISGNAQFMHGKRILHHGTLLFKTSPQIVSSALLVDDEKISSKGIKSVKSRITTISEHLNEPLSAEDFINLLENHILKENPDCKKFDITPHLPDIEKLRDEKYAKWEWNYGYSPKYDFCRRKKFSFGILEINLSVGDSGVIENAKIYGDFFSQKPIDELSDKLAGLCHKREDIEKFLLNIKLDDYIFGSTNEDFLNLLF